MNENFIPLKFKDNPLFSDAKNPIIFALDVTGSMGDWAKIIYQKLPMFYGQIMMQQYLSDPAISFCAIGDHKVTEDPIPIQICEFKRGKELDEVLSQLVLWKSGGGNEHESYELTAYFYDSLTKFSSSEMPFFFVTGDEGFWEEIEINTLKNVYGVENKQSINSRDVWKNLMKKYNVFHIHKPYTSVNYENKIHKQWIETIGEERVLDISNPKACVDVILGAIALTSGRTLENYINDMKKRGQDEDRIKEVIRAIEKYSKKLENKEIIPITFEIYENNIDTNENLLQIRESFEKLLLSEVDSDTISYFENLKQLIKKTIISRIILTSKILS